MAPITVMLLVVIFVHYVANIVHKGEYKYVHISYLNARGGDTYQKVKISKIDTDFFIISTYISL